MRLHTKFSRFKGGASPALGSDGAASVPPTGAPTQTKDNVLLATFANAAGYPVHRVAVAYKGPTAMKIGYD